MTHEKGHFSNCQIISLGNFLVLVGERERDCVCVGGGGGGGGIKATCKKSVLQWNELQIEI